MSWLKSLWRGEAPLWVAYWVIGFLIGNALVFTLEALVPPDFDPSAAPLRTVVAAGLVVALSIAWIVFCVVSIWRCAPNTGWRGWTALARLSLVFSVGSGLFSFWHEFTNALR